MNTRSVHPPYTQDKGRKIVEHFHKYSNFAWRTNVETQLSKLIHGGRIEREWKMSFALCGISRLGCYWRTTGVYIIIARNYLFIYFFFFDWNSSRKFVIFFARKLLSGPERNYRHRFLFRRSTLDGSDGLVWGGSDAFGVRLALFKRTRHRRRFVFESTGIRNI